jgi:hypothetical protein
MPAHRVLLCRAPLAARGSAASRSPTHCSRPHRQLITPLADASLSTHGCVVEPLRRSAVAIALLAGDGEGGER